MRAFLVVAACGFVWISGCIELAQTELDGERQSAAPQLGLAGPRLAAGGRLPAHGIQPGAAEGGDEAHPLEVRDVTLGQARGFRAGAQDAQPLVDDEEDDTAGACQEGVERRRLKAVDHAATGGENAYPTPRTVRNQLWPSTARSFPRSQLMWTSTVRVSPP